MENFKNSPFFNHTSSPESDMHRVWHSFHGRLTDIPTEDFEIFKALENGSMPVPDLLEKLNGVKSIDRERILGLIQRYRDLEFLVDASFTREAFIADQQKTVLDRHAQSNPKVIYVFLSNSCNLDCDYCYVPPDIRQSQKPEVITEDILRTTFEEFFSTAASRGDKHTEVRLLGGEPLYDVEVFQKAVELGDSIAKQYGIRNKFLVFTNGTKIDEKDSAWFREHADTIHWVISLDGSKDIHDRHRHFAGGEPTHDRVMAGVKLLQRENIGVDFHSVIANHNAPSFLEYMERLKSTGVDRCSFSFMNTPRFLQDGPARELSSIEKHDFLRSAVLKGIELDMYVTGHWKMAVGHLIKGGAFACKAAVESLCITADGKVYPCQRLVSNPSAVLADVKPDFIEGINIDGNQTYYNWLLNSALFKKKCSACSFIGIHSGGCPHPSGAQEASDCECTFYMQFLNTCLELPRDAISFNEFDYQINGMIYENEQ